MANTDRSARAPGVALNEQARETARRSLVVLLGEGPFHQIAMRDAARRAGLGLATLYKYFGGKDAMVRAVLDPELAHLSNALALASRREVGVKARFKAFLTESVAFARDHEDAARAVLVNLPAGLWAGDSDAWTAQRRAILVQIFQAGLRDGSIRSDIDTTALAHMSLGALDAALTARLAGEEAADPARLSAHLFSALWPAVSSD